MYEWMYRRKSRGILYHGFLLLVMGVGLGTEPILAEGTPIRITSNRMEANSQDRKATFFESVVLRTNDLIVQSEVMVMLFKEKSSTESDDSATPSSGRKIKLIDAREKVVITKPNLKATCGHAVYFKDQEKIVLTESPVAWQKGTRVSGLKIIMYLEEDRMEVEGESRVDFLDEGDDG